MQFAREVIVIPEGPFEGEHWREDFQPYAFHVLNLMDTLGFRKYRATGCVQSGKTFNIDIVNLAWHIRERKENVVFGIPEMDMAESVWKEKIEPVFDASPELRWLLPTRGRGSKGGFGTLIKFRNGTALKFMGGTGKDSRRSSFTAPVAIKTEVDRYDTAAEGSREAPPVEQMEARTESFDDLAFSYEECTVTTEEGRIWNEIKAGTGTELYSQCRSCWEWQLPDRDSFHGIEDAVDVLIAAELGRFACVHCGVIWEESDRQQMLRVDRLAPVHRGQTIRSGGDGIALIEGPMPATDRLSIRWNAFLNKFHKTTTIARDEWNALYSKTPDAADLKRRQFGWALPSIPTEFEIVPLTLNDVVNRFVTDERKGIVPPFTRWITRGVDLRGTQLHFVTRAWCSEDGEHWESSAFDIDELPVPSESLNVREALIESLNQLRDERQFNFYRDADDNEYVVNFTLVDGSWQEEVVFSYMLDLEDRGIHSWMVVMGRGQSEPPGKGSYVEPRKVDAVKGPVFWNGEQCHVRESRKFGIKFCMANSDHWKSFSRNGYKTQPGNNGSLRHYQPVTAAEKKTVREYGRHTTAEKLFRKHVPGRGVVDVYRNDSDRHNHYGDADYYCCVGGNMLGVRVFTRERSSPPPAPPREESEPIKMPDGRAYMEI
ncbi:MAG: terminase gpA endonuclease subunit [Pirellulales bacterium]